MSSPDPTRTYEDSILDQFTDEELLKKWDEYVKESEQTATKADMSEFTVWLEDKL